jgi:hypothetical protein
LEINFFNSVQIISMLNEFYLMADSYWCTCAHSFIHPSVIPSMGGAGVRFCPHPQKKTSPGIKTVIRIYRALLEVKNFKDPPPPPFPPHACPNLGFPKPIPGQFLQLHGPGKLEGGGFMVWGFA